MKTAEDKHGGGDAGQQGYIRRRRRCGTETDEVWYNGDGEMGCKDGKKLVKYRQVNNSNLRAYRCSGIMEMADKISGEDRVGRAWWRRCRTTGMDTEVEEMRDGNIIDVGRWRWQNGLEERRRTGKYQQGTTTNLMVYRRSYNLVVGVKTDLHGYSGCIWRLCISYCSP